MLRPSLEPAQLRRTQLVTTYLDWNATSPPHPDVLQAMNAAREELWANPSSVHAAGRKARRVIEEVREQLASALGFSPRDVVFTGGGSEANHLALAGAGILITSRLEHPSIVQQAEYLARRGTRVHFADIDRNGVVSPRAIEQALNEALGERPPEPPGASDGGFDNQNTPLVTLMASNHETGVQQPLEEVAQLVHAHGARLHVDAVQWLGRAPAATLRVADSVSLAAHKFRGPKGIGVLAFRCGWTPLPAARGGAQERGLRPGTLDAATIVGLGVALGRLEESERAYGRASSLAQQFEAILTRQVAQAVVHGSAVQRMGHVTNFRVPGWRGDELVAALDMEGICVSSGSACSAGTAEPSPVIVAMLGEEAARGAVRVSFGESSEQADLEALTAAMTRLGILEGN